MGRHAEFRCNFPRRGVLPALWHSVPILLAPMAGACPPLSAALANAGSMGAMGAVLSSSADIGRWMEDFRATSTGPAQVNLWLPDPAPSRNVAAEAASRAFLAQWGPDVPASAADATPADFEEQFAALLAARPAVASTIMGVLLPRHVQQLKDAIAWIACATTLSEARAAQDAGADAVVAQGMEAGGHRGAFDPAMAERQLVGLFALLPRLADHLQIPVIAAGGIADGRGIAAALTLGPAPSRSAPPSCARPRRRSHRRGPMAGRQRTGRYLADARVQRPPWPWPGDRVCARCCRRRPAPRPYPVQRGLTAPMRKQAVQEKSPGGDAGLGRAVGVDGACTAGRRCAARHVGTGAGAAAMRVTCNGQPARWRTCRRW